MLIEITQSPNLKILCCEKKSIIHELRVGNESQFQEKKLKNKSHLEQLW